MSGTGPGTASYEALVVGQHEGSGHAGRGENVDDRGGPDGECGGDEDSEVVELIKLDVLDLVEQVEGDDDTSEFVRVIVG